MLPPPITRPTLAPIFTMSATSVARRSRILKSKPVPFCPARASPDSLSRTRLYLRSAKLVSTPRPSGSGRSGEPGCSPPCLLYTSDAADDLLCVDLGGRRIIKKKKNKNNKQNYPTHTPKQQHNHKETYKP